MLMLFSNILFQFFFKLRNLNDSLDNLTKLKNISENSQIVLIFIYLIKIC